MIRSADVEVHLAASSRAEASDQGKTVTRRALEPPKEAI